MLFLELKFNDEKILVNLDKVSSVSAAKFRDGKDATMLVVGKEHVFVSNTYEDVRDRIMQQQGSLYQSPAIKKL